MKYSITNNQEPKRAIVEFVRYFSLFISKIIWRIEFIDTENIPNDLEKGFIIMPNHQTYLDPFWVCIPIKKDMRYMAWDEAFEMLFIGRMLRAVGAFPVSLKRGGTIKALKNSLKLLREDKALLIFPEGEREFEVGELLDFKTGAVSLALKANVPILPVTVRGGNRIWSRAHKFPRPGKVQIIYHSLIEPDTLKDFESLQNSTDHIKKIIKSELI